MRETLSVFKNSTFRRFSNNSKQHDSNEQHATGLTTSLLNFMKPRCLGKAMKKKRQLHDQKEKQQLFLKNNNSTHQLTTLEEWIMASPCLNRSFTKQDNLHGNSKDYYNKVCPSLDDDEDPAGKYTSMEKLLKVDECKILKVKNSEKRVSFRLPVVADIFILDSPEVLVQKC